MGGIFDAPPLRRLAALLVSGVVAWLGVVSVMVFLSEGREQMATGQIVARPNAALVTGVAGFTGELYRADLMTAPPAEAKAFLENCSAVLYCNLAVPRDEGLYLLGDSTPLYFVGRGPATLVYHTTWDRSPLGLGITANPNQPERWGDGLRAAGVKWVLVNIGELDRLGKSGWYDPAVNSQNVADWLRLDGELVRRWERTGQLLFRLKPATVSPALPNSASPQPSGGGA